ncbi:MAG: LEA type 2 family protein [Thermoanaerobaculum sp.]|nr:LEA type 2 family protein [Thermoanaerobaculum sp.]
MTAGLLLLLALPRPSPTPFPQATIDHLQVELASEQLVEVTLTARGWQGPWGPLRSHTLVAGTVNLPLEGGPDVQLTAEGFEARLSLPLPLVPEAILELDPNRCPLRYSLLDAQGRVVVAASATLDLGDRETVALPVNRIYQLFFRLDRWRVEPSLTGVGFSALFSVLNPFSFPLTVRRIQYSLTGGETVIWEGRHPGLRLPPQRRGDVLVEAELGLDHLKELVGVLASSASLALRGQLWIQTPAGEKAVPFVLTPP